MTCRELEILLASGEATTELDEHLRQCASCRALNEDLAANALAMESLRSEELPAIAFRTPRRRWAYGFVSAAAAAIIAVALLAHRAPPAARPAPPVEAVVRQPPSLPAPEPPPVRKTVAVPPRKVEPLKIKMLTSDPDVVIYWIVD